MDRKSHRKGDFLFLAPTVLNLRTPPQLSRNAPYASSSSSIDPTPSLYHCTTTCYQYQPSKILRSAQDSQVLYPLLPYYIIQGVSNLDTARFLTIILQPLMGSTPHHISNSMQFVDLTRNLSLKPTDIMVCFDVVSYCPVHQCSQWRSFQDNEGACGQRPLPNWLQSPFILPERWAYLPVSSSYFWFQDKFYKQAVGTAMSSPISPVLVNFFIEEFEI